MMGRKIRRENIVPLILRGDYEFAQAYGIHDKRRQSQLRREGMPCFKDGDLFCYDPEEVTVWLKKRGQIFNNAEL
jgi:hypothetical protein